MDTKAIDIRFVGVRPILFDRYAGDNVTKLPTHEKLYVDNAGGLVIPSLNIFSMLIAENTKSVCRQFHGKAGKTIGLGIGANLEIRPYDIPLLGESEKQIRWTGEWTKQISIRKDVARVKGGIPNAKERPEVALPWSLEFTAEWMENSDCSTDMLRLTFDLGRKLGLGTFRPFFGTFRLDKFDVQ